jgi:methylmalonyl-CoA/ethylmalonyl-CoA epimerase
MAKNIIFREDNMDSNQAEKAPFANLFQIGVVVKDLDKTIERLKALGIGPFYSKTPPPTARSLFRGKPFIPVERVNIQAAMMGNAELELVQPLKGESPHKEYLDEKGEGIQHIAFRVDDLDKATEMLTSRGCTLLMKGDRGDGGGVAYIDLNAGGIIVELVKH